jgi:hypothetical protein
MVRTMARVGLPDCRSPWPYFHRGLEGESTTHSLSEFAHSDTEVIWNGSMFVILVAFVKNERGQYADADDPTVASANWV